MWKGVSPSPAWVLAVGRGTIANLLGAFGQPRSQVTNSTALTSTTNRPWSPARNAATTRSTALPQSLRFRMSGGFEHGGRELAHTGIGGHARRNNYILAFWCAICLAIS